MKKILLKTFENFLVESAEQKALLNKEKNIKVRDMVRVFIYEKGNPPSEFVTDEEEYYNKTNEENSSYKTPYIAQIIKNEMEDENNFLSKKPKSENQTFTVKIERPDKNYRPIDEYSTKYNITHFEHKEGDIIENVSISDIEKII